jgi:eukaryotic-like serine/threonine-protein kinase
MAFSAGARLGPYEIISLLGSGGMGEVYRARDSRLGRDVAIKVLPAALAADPDRLQRLEREARAAAALNHPNIVTVYAVERSDGILFLTMELIEGQSLDHAIAKGGLRLDELLKIAIPLTDAIAAAHSKGITHRDLKPANIMIGSGDHDGRVKVLDFGLAKLDESSALAAGATTITTEDRVVGTAAYMSPEQAAGRPIDARSDLFSLGVILYEMATGQRPFKGDTNVTVLSSILKDTPPTVTDINRALPSELSRIIKHCMVKDPARRYQTAADLRNELAELKEDLNSGALAASGMVKAPAAAPARWPLRVLVGAGIVVGVAGAAAFRWWSPHATADRPLAGADRAFTQLTTQPGLEEFPSLSPDGKWIVYDGNQAGNADIYLQSVGGHNSINLTKDSPEDDIQPAFSPDGESIAFRSDRAGGGIFVMGRTGESVRRVTDSGYSPAWSPDGMRLVFATALPHPFNASPSELWAVMLATGEKRRLSNVDGVQPNWSPHGQRIVYWTALEKGTRRGQRDIWTVPADGGQPTPLTSDAALDWCPVWSPDGRFVYFSSDRGGSMNLWRIPLDEDTGRVLGPPEALTTPSPDSRHLSISADGRLVAYASFGETASIQKVSFDSAAATVTGTPDTVVGGSRYLSHVDVAPDGRWLAYYSRGRQFNIWISRSDGTGERQLTNEQAYDRNPRFSPDGQWIAFMSNRSGKNQSWLVRPDGSGLRQATDAANGAGSHNPWSPDGSQLICPDDITDQMYVFDPRKPWKGQLPQVLSGTTDDGSGFIPMSWSPDGTRLLGDAGSQEHEQVLAYTFSTKRFTRLSDVGTSWAWLNDSRRLLYTHHGELFLLDSVSKSSQALLSVAPDDFDGVALSSDNRTIYYSRATRQGDIWLMTRK